MKRPLLFLFEHEKMILAAYGENNAKPKDAWASLEKELPDLSRIMTFNTFKQYVSVFAFVKTELDKVRQNEISLEVTKIENEKQRIEEQLQNANQRLDKVRQDRDEILKKLNEALAEKDRLKAELKKQSIGLDKVRQTKQAEFRVRQKLHKKPHRISGWTVQHSKDGYYRCYRKKGNRVHSVYLGKELDVEDAKNRITAKEKSLGLISD